MARNKITGPVSIRSHLEASWHDLGKHSVGSGWVRSFTGSHLSQASYTECTPQAARPPITPVIETQLPTSQWVLVLAGQELREAVDSASGSGPRKCHQRQSQGFVRLAEPSFYTTEGHHCYWIPVTPKAKKEDYWKIKGKKHISPKHIWQSDLENPELVVSTAWENS